MAWLLGWLERVAFAFDVLDGPNVLQTGLVGLVLDGRFTVEGGDQRATNWVIMGPYGDKSGWVQVDDRAFSCKSLVCYSAAGGFGRLRG